MKDFESVKRYQPEDVRVGEMPWETSQANMWEDNDYGEFVLHSNYKELLEEFNYSNTAASENYLFFEIVTNFMVENDLLKITHEGGAKEAALNVCDSIKALNEKYLELKHRVDGLDK